MLLHLIQIVIFLYNAFSVYFPFSICLIYITIYYREKSVIDSLATEINKSSFDFFNSLARIAACFIVHRSLNAGTKWSRFDIFLTEYSTYKRLGITEGTILREGTFRCDRE